MYKNDHRTARKLSDKISTLTRQVYVILDQPADEFAGAHATRYALARWEGQGEYTLCSKWQTLPALIHTLDNRLDKIKSIKPAPHNQRAA